MGFLNFILKRQHSTEAVTSEAALLKAQSYEDTIASIPPILGTTPVPGNGTNPILIAANQQKLQVQLNTGDVSHKVASPRLRGSTFSRPSTAASVPMADVPLRPRTSSGQTLAPKLELYHLANLAKGHRKQGSTATSRYSISTNDGPPYKMPPKPWVDHELSKRNSLRVARTSTRSSSSSMQTFSKCPDSPSRSKPHVDLLDAQSTIKPLDFYDRVKAAGAKTYGEDVADRNRTQSLMTRRSEPGFEDNDDTRAPRKRHSLGHGLRTSSMSSSAPRLEQNVIEAAPDSELIAKRKAAKASRRRSMPATGLHSQTAPKAKASPPIGLDDPAAFPDSLREKAAALAKNELAIVRAAAAMPKPNRIRVDDTAVSPKTQSPARSRKASDAQSEVHEISAFAASPEKGSVPRRKHSEDRADSMSQRPRNTSGASLTMSSIQQLDLDNSVPDRSSSLRNWSITSGSFTAYTYDCESNPRRPQSSHTTNTSVDLTPVSPTKIYSPSQISVSSAAPRKSLDSRHYTMESSGRHTTHKKSPLGRDSEPVMINRPITPPRSSPDQFHIDDYASSVDSFGSPKRNLGDEEKDLLFSDDAFGGQMFQLPGIHQPPVPLDASERKLSKSGETRSISAFTDFSAYSAPPSFGQVSATRSSKTHRRSPRKYASRQKSYNYTRPSHDYSDSEGGDSGVDADSEDDWSLDIPITRPPPSRLNRQSQSARHLYQAERAIIMEEGLHGSYAPVSPRRRHDRQQPRTSERQRASVRHY